MLDVEACDFTVNPFFNVTSGRGATHLMPPATGGAVVFTALAPDVWVKFIAGGEPANLTASLDIVVQSNDKCGTVQP